MTSTLPVGALQILALALHELALYVMEGKYIFYRCRTTFKIDIMLQRYQCCSTCCDTCSSCSTTWDNHTHVRLLLTNGSTWNIAAGETPLHAKLPARISRMPLLSSKLVFLWLNQATSFSSCNCSCCSDVFRLYCTVYCPVCYNVNLKVRYKTAGGNFERTTYSQDFRHDNNSASWFFSQHLVNSTSPCYYNPHDFSQVGPFLHWVLTLLHNVSIRFFSMYPLRRGNGWSPPSSASSLSQLSSSFLPVFSWWSLQCGWVTRVTITWRTGWGIGTKIGPW